MGTGDESPPTDGCGHWLITLIVLAVPLASPRSHEHPRAEWCGGGSSPRQSQSLEGFETRGRIYEVTALTMDWLQLKTPMQPQSHQSFHSLSGGSFIEAARRNPPNSCPTSRRFLPNQLLLLSPGFS